MSKREDLTGRRFGMLTVIGFAEDAVTSSGTHLSQFRCMCDCGKEVNVRARYLKSGDTKSCGSHYNNLFQKKHGMHGTRLYRIWCGIKSRCLNKNNKDYSHYGGRGIAVCDEWMEFLPFYEWAISNGYSDDLSIDRVDVNGNYCPGNCRWATQVEQQNNRTNNIIHKNRFYGKSSEI